MTTNTTGRAASLLLLISLVGNAAADPPESSDDPASKPKLAMKRRVSGKLLLPSGKTTSNVEVATYWSANGRQWNVDESFPDLDTAAAISKFWDDEGRMEPYPPRRATKVRDGQFMFEDLGSNPYVVFALNKQRTLGGLVYADPKTAFPLHVQLAPLTRVSGEIRCGGSIPDWSYACVFPGTIKQVPD